jgi:hypothetical protein
MNKKTSSGALVLAALLIGSGVTLLLGEGTAFAQQPSAGDVAQARELFNEGLALRDKGDLAGAIEKLRAADALARTPITGIELGRTYLSAGKLVEARETLLAVGRLRVTPQETARSTSARAEAARLAEQVRARIPSLVIQISGVPIESVAVTIDGAAVPTEALTAPRLVNPGSHVLVATSTSGGSTTTKVDVKEGESRTVQLTITFTGGAPAPPAGTVTLAPPAAGAQDTVPPAQPSSSSPVRSVLLFGGFGLAAAGAVAGSVTGVMALSKGSSVKNACDGLICPTSVNGDLTSGRSLATVSTISFVVAGVGAVAGVVGLALHPHAEGGAAAWLTPWVAPGGAGMAGALRF